MKLRTIALAGASLIAFVTPAAAGTGWYLGLGLGWTQLQSVDAHVTTPAVAGSGHGSFNTTVRGDVAAGFKTASGVRIELEDGYGEYKVKSASFPSGTPIAGASGHLSISTMMVDIAYDRPITPQFGFTVGGGLGLGSVLAHYDDPTQTIRKSDKAFAYQAIVGVTYAVSPQLDLQLAYRYIAVDNTTHDYASIFGIPSGKIQLAEVDSHNVEMSLRWYP
jgi:opacity protein-like surface antigen